MGPPRVGWGEVGETIDNFGLLTEFRAAVRPVWIFGAWQRPAMQSMPCSACSQVNEINVGDVLRHLWLLFETSHV